MNSTAPTFCGSVQIASVEFTTPGMEMPPNSTHVSKSQRQGRSVVAELDTMVDRLAMHSHGVELGDNLVDQLLTDPRDAAQYSGELP